MLLSAVSVLVVAQSSSEIPEGLMNNPVVDNDVPHAATVERYITSSLQIPGPVSILPLLPSQISFWQGY